MSSGTRAKTQPGRAKQPVAKRPAATTTRRSSAKAPARPTALRKAPGRKAAVRQAPVRKSAVRKRATRATTARKAPLRTAPVRRSPAAKSRASAPPRRRLITLLVLMSLALGVIVVRLVDVQAIEGHHYVALAEAQRVRKVSLAAERGSIFDRNGKDLALSVPQHTIYADPRQVTDPTRYAIKLAPIVHVDRFKLQRRLAQSGTAFVYIARKVDEETAARVAKLKLRGIGSVPESKRFYPGGGLAGPVLGFVGTDNNGLGGLEAGYESTLRGKPGEVVAEEDPNGREIPATERIDDPARRGGDLVLSLDQSLQYEVEQQLTAQVNSAHARGGIAIVADVKTGDILAMASADGAQGSTPARLASASESNRPLTTVYEPGSTAKVITVGGALEAGVVQPDTSFWVPWRLKIADREFSDAEQHNDASWTVSDIVRQSSNIGVIKIADLLGKERLDHYQRAFGFGSKTAINFPAESAGLMKSVANYVPSDMGSIPIGYTTAVTPMQMLDVFVTVANGGVTRPPRLVDATIGSDGTRHDLPVRRGHRIVSEKTAAELNQMLRGVVTGGTGTEAQVSGYTVAGKTGTSRKPPYEPTPRYMASFAGFAPAESPRLAAIVVIDQPGTSNEEYFGGKVAAPLFSRIMQYALRLEHVPPTTTMSAEASSPGLPPNDSTPKNSGSQLTAAGLAPASGRSAGIVAQPVP
ncbi:MAG: penicillin-binding transpeptidase domain-containing protein [Acidimicrobiia bacterium]